MKTILTTVITISLGLFSYSAVAATFGQTLCQQEAYECYKVKKGETWQTLFPDEAQRTLVKKINRMNTGVRSGMTIAVPDNPTGDTLDFAPFPHKISPEGEKVVKVDLSDLAWGAYDADGNLVNWGPVSGGKSYCSDIGRGCRTITGEFTVYRKQGSGCKSSRFPVGRGGAPMPYCMHFKGGYAMHGSPTVPGYNASHGCVRMFTEDAQWLNHNFVNVGSTRVEVSQ